MQKPFSCVALIPARGGSKSIQKKNLIPVFGKPLIMWSIEVAKRCQNIDRVIVSTDCKDIAQVAKSAGAEVPFMRPERFATDSSLDLEVFLHAARWLAEHEGEVPDFFVHLRPTEPARVSRVVESAISSAIGDGAADSLRSVNVAEETPFKMWFMDDAYLNPVLNPSGDLTTCSMPRQELPIAYHQNGYIDVIRTTTITKKHSMVGDLVRAFVINDPITSIDYYSDIPRAEEELRHIHSSDSDYRNCDVEVFSIDKEHPR
jgi:CMP-N-acetylneuraminic acid synthetase